jgi:hypothetical protein
MDSSRSMSHSLHEAKRDHPPPVHINNVQLPQEEDVKYLGLHLDRRLTWYKHIFAKLGITLIKTYWLFGCKSTNFSYIKQYSNQSGLIESNIEILERFQSKALCMIVDAPWFVPNVI